MIRHKGKSLPVSMFKSFLPDQTLDQLVEIAKMLEVKTSTEALVLSISAVHAQLKAFNEQENKNEDTEAK